MANLIKLSPKRVTESCETIVKSISVISESVLEHETIFNNLMDGPFFTGASSSIQAVIDRAKKAEAELRIRSEEYVKILRNAATAASDTEAKFIGEFEKVAFEFKNTESIDSAELVTIATPSSTN